MKTFVRIGSLVIALGLAGLLAGCASNNAQTSRRARNFEVVETSTKRNLTPTEMAQLQVMVAEYLKKEGVTDSGDYYVKVYLTQDKDGVPGEWVVVRYTQPTKYVTTRFSLMSSYPDYGYYSYYPRYNFDFYPFGWFGFNTFALSYYDDPFYYRYGYGSYPPRRGYGNHHGHHHDRDRDRDHNHRPREPRDPNRPTDNYRPSGALKPSYVPSNTGPRPRGPGNPATQDVSSGGNNFPNNADSRQRWRGRNDSNGPTAPTTTAPNSATRFKPSAPSSGPRNQATVDNSGAAQRPSRPTYNRERSPSDNNRTSRENATSHRRDYGGHERGRNQNESSSQPVQTATYTPPPARSEPAPSYSPPPATRSELHSGSRQSSDTRDGSHDGGRRARSE